MPPAPRPSAVPSPAGASRVAAARVALLCGVIAGVGASAATAQQRPAPAEMRVPTLSPALEATLQAWYDATKGVRKLEGRHTKVESDETFRVEKHSAGRFFYEAPDKGRIDMTARPAAEMRPRVRPGGAPFKAMPGDETLWVCNGEDLKKLDVARKEATVTEIPPQHRGRNIMNGPLPFLLGMPPEAVKKRFRVSFPGPAYEPTGDVAAWLRDPNSTVMLRVLPLQPQDSENWKQALVELSKPDFMPIRVKLTDPGGKSDTTYEFSDLRRNKEPLFPLFAKDPFAPDLRGYKFLAQNVAGSGPSQTAQGPRVAPVARPQTVPSVVGLTHEQAAKVLTGLGYAVDKRKGKTAPRPELVGRIQAQQYPEGQALPAGQKVGVMIWMPAVQQAGSASPAQ